MSETNNLISLKSRSEYERNFEKEKSILWFGIWTLPKNNWWNNAIRQVTKKLLVNPNSEEVYKEYWTVGLGLIENYVPHPSYVGNWKHEHLVEAFIYTTSQKRQEAIRFLHTEQQISASDYKKYTYLQNSESN